MPNKKYVIGDKVGRLTILAYVGYDQAGKQLVESKCDCGNLKITRLNNIGRKTNSCGCYKADLIKERMGKPISHLAIVKQLSYCKKHTKDSDLTYEDIDSLIFSKCYYCEQTPDIVGMEYKRPIRDGRSIKRIGIDRIDNNKGYYKNNVVGCCKDCNYIKRNHDVQSLIGRLEKFVINLKKIEAKNE